MAKNITVIISLFIFSNLSAQVLIPKESPPSELNQVVGLTNITIRYSRPQLKGRTMFGDYIPYGKVWAIGADEITQIVIDNPLIIKDKRLEIGTYSVFAIPNKDSWEIIFCNDPTNFGASDISDNSNNYEDLGNSLVSEYDESQIALRVGVESIFYPIKTDTFTIRIDDVSSHGAKIAIVWENTYVSIPFKVETDIQVKASIEETLNSPSGEDYYAAASYYLSIGKDIEKARLWIDKAVELSEEPSFWYLRQKALIYAKLGDFDTALFTLAIAKKFENAEYDAISNESLKEWGWKSTEIYCCSNHEKKHCGELEKLEELSSKKGCKGFN
ncbi:DUF2911 domain-containing protein [Winogradskyella sp.]|uniref:DUF2911 domain-containing protein n=1 Tax=Winogradskyella sp. TaxID=1883156 RepID=UPI00260502A9|nr:DUF2911 domain-containing protein [Winogradskyella sp.]